MNLLYGVLLAFVVSTARATPVNNRPQPHYSSGGGISAAVESEEASSNHTTKHSSRVIGPEFFFTGRMFIKCFPTRMIWNGTLVPNYDGARQFGLARSDFILFTPGDPKAGRNLGRAQSVCKRCRCSSSGMIEPDYTPLFGLASQAACNNIVKSLRCTFQLGCYCYQQLGNPDPEEGVSIEEYQNAINQLGLTEKHGNPGWGYQGLVPSEPHPGDPYRTHGRQRAPDTKEPYWLEGPEYHQDLKKMASEMGDGISYLVDLKSAGYSGSNLGSVGAFKRDLNSENGMELQTRTDEV
ncbi:hypothetical protein TWF718_003859 [Orbilia javanica]|uniref:Uncharacterized protein n=1 Tax=Orbilia javanica TaxID=47235 RepID=A0AAN8MU20_9PEZI